MNIKLDDLRLDVKPAADSDRISINITSFRENCKLSAIFQLFLNLDEAAELGGELIKLATNKRYDPERVSLWSNAEGYELRYYDDASEKNHQDASFFVIKTYKGACFMTTVKDDYDRIRKTGEL